MKIEVITKNKDELLQKNVNLNVIFNRFDLRYRNENYLLFKISDTNRTLYIPGYIFNKTIKLGCYGLGISSGKFKNLCSYIFKYYQIDFIEVENIILRHNDLMPELSYSIDISKKDYLADTRTKELAGRLKQDHGKYAIIHTEKPASEDKTTEQNMSIDEPTYKARLKNMDIFQIKINNETQAMLLVSVTDENVVFENISSNYDFNKAYDIEFILCIEAIIFFQKENKKTIFLNGTCTEFKRRFEAIVQKGYYGVIFRDTNLYKIINYIPIKIANIINYLAPTTNGKNYFSNLLDIRNSENYKLDKQNIWFDFYETKEDANLASFEYFNHETSKNYIDILLSECPTLKNKNFMDIGCGTGYVMYKVRNKFKTVYGIEVEQKWINIATTNFQNAGMTNYKISNTDINSVNSEIFDNIHVFYLFNPFVGETMKNFVKKLEQSLIRKKRKITVIYMNALDHKTFAKSPLLKIKKELTFNDRKHVVYTSNFSKKHKA